MGEMTQPSGSVMPVEKVQHCDSLGQIQGASPSPSLKPADLLDSELKLLCGTRPSYSPCFTSFPLHLLNLMPGKLNWKPRLDDTVGPTRQFKQANMNIWKIC